MADQPFAAPWFFGTAGIEQVSGPDAIANSVRAAQAMEALGYSAIGLTDQTQSWIFRSLWSPDLIPSAAIYPDHEAFFDTIPLMAALAMGTERIRMGATIDAYRRPPGLLAQTLNTLDHISKGRVSVSLGTGENKQFLPYGLERTEPRNARLEEMVASLKALMRSPDPVTRESKYHPLEDALIGLQPYDPEHPMSILVSGGGPRVMKLVARVADGWTTYLPGAYADRLEALEEDLAVLREECEAIGRDPATIAMNVRNIMMMLCENDEQIEACYESLYTRSMVLNLTPMGKHWRLFGEEHPLGDDWALSVTHRSTSFTRDEAIEVCSKVTDDAISHLVYIGTPEDVAERAAPWLRAAGITRARLTYSTNYACWAIPELAEPGPDGNPRWHHLNVRYTEALDRLLQSP